jgi:hypothetical protein
MFGSMFRSILVIGTIYALSPVRLDATTLPSTSHPNGKTIIQGQKTTPVIEASAIQASQAAALAMVTGGRPVKEPSKPVQTATASTGPHQADQIGDLIALGKDLCLANPGLCAEIARSAAASAASAVSSKTTTAQPIENAKDKNKPQSAASRVAPQPDVLGALIEKVAAPAPKAVPEKMVAKVQR